MPSMPSIWKNIRSRNTFLTYDSSDGFWYVTLPDGTDPVLGKSDSLPKAIQTAADQGYDCTYWCRPAGWPLLSTKSIRRKVKPHA